MERLIGFNWDWTTFTVWSIGILGAWLLGYFGTRLQARKKVELRLHRISVRAEKTAKDTMKYLPINTSLAIYIPSATVEIIYAVALTELYSRFFMNAHFELIYRIWTGLFLNVNPEAQYSWAMLTAIIIIIPTMFIALGMMFLGRTLSAMVIQRACAKQGFTVDVRARSGFLAVVCYIGAAIAIAHDRWQHSRAVMKRR